MNQISSQSINPSNPSRISFRQRSRPTSAISTTSTIIDQSDSINPSTSINHSSFQLTSDYENRLKLINENRSKLNLRDSNSTSNLNLNIHHQINRRRVTFDDDHPIRRPIKIEFLLASSTKPNLNRLNLSFDSHSKALDIKNRIKSQWPIGWSAEGIIPKRADEIKLLFLGRFLNDSETLDSLRLANGSPTIMHLLLRPINSDPQLSKEGDSKFIKWNCCYTTTTTTRSETDQIPSQCCIIS